MKRRIFVYEYSESETQTQTQVMPEQNTRNTGPMDGLKDWFNGWNDRRKNQSYASQNSGQEREKIHDKDERSAIEKMRDKVAEFDEDYKGIGERLLGFFMQL